MKTNKFYFLNLFLFCCCCLFSNTASAAPGDTTLVQAHNAVDMVWHGNYDQIASFPDGSKQYRKINMYYTMGCSSNQCSDWDYTTQIFLMPDTTDGSKNMELARVITPYGGYMANSINGFDPSWEHTHVFDVTDFGPVLKNDVMMRAFYDGWSDGFSVTVWFEFIEGTPVREVLSIENVYHGSGAYTNAAAFDTTNFRPQNVDIPANVDRSRVRVSITGHGFDNAANCAEFCQKEYDLKLNGTEVAKELMWRDDCGLNPIYPQGGTWIYNRADWCPGDKTRLHTHDLTMLPGQNELDFHVQNYFWSGNQAPYYIYDIQLVNYGAPNFTRDVEIIDIIAPSNQDAYGRMNPICAEPRIKIRNTGSDELTSVVFQYGVVGADFCRYTWTGNLAFLEETEVDLPAPLWAGLDVSNPVFRVTAVGVNTSTDEYNPNSTMESSFELPEKFTQPIMVKISTNSAGGETGYELADNEGNVVKKRNSGSMASNTTYVDSFNLDPGCYILRIIDTGKDGLAFGGGSVGSASVNYLDGSVAKSFNPNFGTELYLQFTMGDLEDVAALGSCNVNSNEEILTSSSALSVQPNPNEGQFTFSLNGIETNQAALTVKDLLGRTVYQEEISGIRDGYTKSVVLDNPVNGIYFVTVRVGEKKLTKKVLIRK